METPIGWLRAIAFLEGCSFLLLLGIAMPLKYIWDMPLAVRIVGAVHGGLFILFCVALVRAWSAARWSLSFAVQVFVSSIVPFGTFYMDGRLRREDNLLRAAQGTSRSSRCG